MRGVTSTRASITARGVVMVAHPPCCDSKLARQFRRNFAEQFRLQFREMRQRARHPARGVMLGQAIGRQHVGKALIAGDFAYAIVGPLFLVAAGFVC